MYRGTERGARLSYATYSIVDCFAETQVYTNDTWRERDRGAECVFPWYVEGPRERRRSATENSLGRDWEHSTHCLMPRSVQVAVTTVVILRTLCTCGRSSSKCSVTIAIYIFKTSAILLANISENFCDSCITSYGLDPAYYYTVSGFTWGAMLKHTCISFELLTDIDMVMFIEHGIRDGLKQCSNTDTRGSVTITCCWMIHRHHSRTCYTSMKKNTIQDKPF